VPGDFIPNAILHGAVHPGLQAGKVEHAVHHAFRNGDCESVGCVHHAHAHGFCRFLIDRVNASAPLGNHFQGGQAGFDDIGVIAVIPADCAFELTRMAQNFFCFKPFVDFRDDGVDAKMIQDWTKAIHERQHVWGRN